MRFHRSMLSGIAVAGLAVAGCGGDDESTSSSASTPATTTPSTQTTAAPATKPSARIATALAEYTVTATPPVGKAGLVTFQATNGGQLAHELVVIKTPKRADALLKGSEADESGAVGEIGDLPPGATKTLKVKMTPGHYVLLCNLPGHYSAGQRTDFTVR